MKSKLLQGTPAVLLALSVMALLGGCKNPADDAGGGGVDFNSLQEKIIEAEELVDGVEQSEDGSGVPSNKLWVTGAIYGAMTGKIEEAKAMVLAKAASQAAVNEMIGKLNSYMGSFSDALEPGSAPEVQDNIEEALDALRAKIAEAGPVQTYANPDTATGGQLAVMEETAENNNVPGLFIDFGHYWVPKETADTLKAAVNAAQAIIDDEASATLDAANTSFTELSNAITAYTEQKKEGLALFFVDVPAGSFTRYGGTTTLNTTAVDSTITKSYKMSQYEITVGQWEAVMGTSWPSEGAGSKYDSKSSPSELANGASRSRFPAARISWYDAIAFCNRLSALTGKNTVYTVNGVTNWSTITAGDIDENRPSGSDNTGPSAKTEWDNTAADWDAMGYRLPTEWEWQWAAMGASADATYAGTGTNADGYKKAYAGANAVIANGTSYTGRASYAWLSIDDTNTAAVLDGTRPVGLKLPNELGLYDMSGNVAEWCWDKINAGNNQAANTTGSVTTDYRGPATGTNARRIGHGGDWENTVDATYNRPSIWNRTGLYTHIGYTQSGIRLVINAETSGE